MRHTGIVVKNLQKSLQFYRDLLGLSVWKQEVETGEYIDNVVGVSCVTIEWAKLRVGEDMLLELLEYRSHADEQFHGVRSQAYRVNTAHIAFTIDDCDKAYKTLTQQGYHCNAVPQRSPDGRVNVMYCYDPDGFTLELVEEVQL